MDYKPGDRTVFVYPGGYVFGTILPPKTKNGSRLRLAVVYDGATHIETGDRQTTRVEYRPDWYRVVATYGITNKTKRLIGWINPLDGQRELWPGGIPHFFELYVLSDQLYTHDTVHDW